MERNANFIVVGLFSILSLLLLAGFIFWLGKYGVDEEKYDNYKTYVSESVAGLKTSSPVKLKGLDVGFIETVKIDGDNPERVEIRFKVEKTTPIKTDSIVVLNSQGIAGVGFLEIKGGTKNTPFLKSVDKNECPNIKSEPSMFSKLTEKVDQALNNLTATVAKVNRLASNKNINNVSTSLENFAQISTELKDNRKEFTSMIHGAKGVEDNANKTLDYISKVAQKTDTVLDETKNAVQESSALVKEIKQAKMIEKIGIVLDNSNDTINETKILVNETKSLVNEGKMLVQQLRESPSDLLFKSKSSNPPSDE
jgi:phospholipid/cholesterol/gamma-HCH transport system substrate-binding protein